MRYEDGGERMPPRSPGFVIGRHDANDESTEMCTAHGVHSALGLPEPGSNAYKGPNKTGTARQLPHRY